MRLNFGNSSSKAVPDYPIQPPDYLVPPHSPAACTGQSDVGVCFRLLPDSLASGIRQSGLARAAAPFSLFRSSAVFLHRLCLSHCMTILFACFELVSHIFVRCLVVNSQGLLLALACDFCDR